ncbi:hypothetical protein RUM43_011128 [Polyplax serrata]|uniref:Cathepsin L n=1 Tax=Polyplax serrata TaxID=468196 RepID=A0AAN8P8Q6_POLSC
MRSIVLLSVILVAAAAATTDEKSIQAEWDLFKSQYGKSYENPSEEYRRMRIFMNNLNTISEHNLKYQKGEVSFEVGINKFSDMLSEEVDDLYTGVNRVNRLKALNGEEVYIPELKGKQFVPTKVDVPDFVDWTHMGAVTAVRNQKTCGACYAFSALAALEGRLYLKSKWTPSEAKIQALSVQNIIDCSEDYGNNGCHGGLAMYTYDYILSNKGLNNETVYPYEGKDGKCRYKPEQSIVTMKDYVKVTPFDENELKLAVATGPVSASFNTNPDSFKMYKSGIYEDVECNANSLNHAMAVVGYGVDYKTNKQYWLVKNSWGTDWGMDGYIKMARNAGNMCGIATRPVFPNVN